ncbi:MAG: hypothetical protein A2X99_04790 [Deltaproteobacteria bacterium GWB2_55_19]|nr:MAG: hypothetical protein A2X99_04790 [Deltaproteobacteria bacterium GWB2_55_19]HAO93073.1 hypothetical protein [Deltaproteobacteria bacterium]
MKRSIVTGAIATLMAVAVFGAPAVSMADEHAHEGIKHMKVGIDHIKEAIDHFELSKKHTRNKHAEKALINARQAIKEAEDAIRHAEEVPDPPVIPLRPLLPPPLR